MVLQDPDSQVILSRVGDDVAFGMENFNVAREQIWRRVADALRAVGLRVPLDHDTSHLSGGQKQRLALAGVIAMNPGLILLDEPTANLDPAGVIEVRDAIEATANQTGATVVVIEHRTEVWLPVVDRVIVLGSAGEIVADGAPDSIIRREHEYLTKSGVWVPGAPAPELSRHRSTRTESLLSATDLSLGYGSDPHLHSGLNFEIGSGRTTVVTGPNGAGKSTLALTLGGLIPPARGRIEVNAEFAPVPEAPRTHLLAVQGVAQPDRQRPFRIPSTSSSREPSAKNWRSGRTRSNAVATKPPCSPTNCSNGFGSATSPRRIPTRCPAARSDGSRSPPCSPPDPS